MNTNTDRADTSLVTDEQQTTLLLNTLLTRASRAGYTMPAGMQPIEERRREPRVNASLVAMAELFGGTPVAAGATVDISVGGMCLQMPRPPAAPFYVITVFGVDGTARVWVQIVGHREARDGRHVWHVQVLAAVDRWKALVDGERAALSDAQDGIGRG